MTFFLLFLACASPSEPTVIDCPQQTNVTVYPAGPIWSAVIDVDGVQSAPMLQIQSDRIVVFCRDNADGVLTVEWGD